MPLVPFVRQSKTDPGYSGERLVNWFLRPADTGVTSGVLVGRSGLDSEASGLGGKVRAAIQFGANVIFVAGGAVWRFDGSTATNVGTVTDGETSIAASGTEVAIVVGGAYYICDGSSTASYFTGAISNPVGVTFQDGYFVVIGTSGGRDDGLTVSGLDDGTTFDALDFAFAENSPDGLVAVISDHGELWLFGNRTTEVWYNSGNPDFPFERNAGALMEMGCGNGQTVAKEDNSVFWLGHDNVVYRASGATPQVISTREIEEAIAGSTIEGGFTFTDRGHKFYALRRTGDTTLCFDLTTGLWCERAAGLDDSPWPCTCRATLSGTEYFGTDDGYVVTQNAATYTDKGSTFQSEAVSAPVMQNGNYFTVNKMHLQVEMGQVDRPDSDPPEIVLQTSKDGRNWSSEKWRELGDLGEYFRRTAWHGLGAFRRFQARIRIMEPVKRDIYGVKYE